MTNPKYQVNISYQEPFRSGSTGATVSGTWVTYPVFSGGWYVASMPEVGILATGSTYETALDALIAIANAPSTQDAAQGPRI